MLAASTLPTGELLLPLLWVFGVATVLVALLHMRQLPSLLGFLLTGVLVGPAGLAVVQDADAIAIMAEIGVVLLMFTIGLEVSLKDLMRMSRMVLGGGAFQIGVTTLLFTGLGLLTGLEMTTAVTIGLLTSASSTALVLRMLGDRGELGAPHGQLALAILLAQDFAVVALMLVLPMLADGGFSVGVLALGLAEGVALAVLIVVLARLAFPWLLQKVVALRSREVFMLATFATLFGTALLAETLGLSLALGAFLAGLVISESDFSHQMFAEVLPFRDIFNGLFFASVGLMIDPEAVSQNLGLLVTFILIIIVGKGVVVAITARMFGLSTNSTILAGVSLGQVGEFGLVLAQLGAVLNLISGTEHSLIIAAAVATMAFTSVALPWATAHRSKGGEIDLPEESIDMSDHVIVVGYGLNGRNVTGVLLGLGVKFVVVEMNQATVSTEAAAGVPIVYGDATRPALLEHLQVRSARALVSAIENPAATREIVSSAHHANPELLIVARTRYVSEIEPLRELGADVVVPEEFETSIELSAHVMRAYGASEAAVNRQRKALRDDRYHVMLDDSFDGDQQSIETLLALLDVAAVSVAASSAIDGMTLAEADFRVNTGASVVAIQREGEMLTGPTPDFRILAGDQLMIAGDAAALRMARQLTAAPTP